MKRLIFDTELNGHHLEYIHHLYLGAIQDEKNEYIFAIPDNFQEYHGHFVWPHSTNISFYFLSAKEIEKCHSNMLLRLFRESKLANKIINIFHIDEIILIDLLTFLPILPIISNKKTIISGIIYNIYLHRNHKPVRRLFEEFRYRPISKRRGRIYILNDEKSVKTLNNKYNTINFTFLPDPIPETAFQHNTNLARDIETTEGKTFLHFGYMSRRKGTLDILKAISLLPEKFKATFIFAGIIDNNISNEFYQLIEKVRNREIKIFVKDKYCEYDYINDLCHISDCILIPYYNTAQSSGVLGYAAAHQIPVIGPKEGLLGYIIESNKLGHTIENITPNILAKAILHFEKYHTNSDYIKTHSINNFINIILA